MSGVYDMSSTIFTAENISKSFPGVKALDNVSLHLDQGELLALLGENGAGKSTLIKIASGSLQPDSGTMTLNGRRISFQNPQEAQSAGIAVVHQELNYIEELTVAENIMMSSYPRNRYRMVDWKKIHDSAVDAMKRLGLDIDPQKKMKTCLVAEKQQIEIARALFWNARMLILDEPTSALNDMEIEKLFLCLKDIRKQGVGIIYISHKLDEIFELADRVTVFRDGQHIGTKKILQTDQNDLIQMMVGREITNLYPEKTNTPGDSVLEVEKLTSEKVRDISFSVKRGEIFGVYGLMGSGHIELGKALFGYDKILSGDIKLKGNTIKIRKSYDAVRGGFAYVPGDRKTEGLVLTHSVKHNIVTVFHELSSAGGLINTHKEEEIADKWVDSLRIKTPNSQAAAGSLSGGNQQKVVLSKWLEVDPDVLILNEPTRGIDVGSKAGIYQLLNDLCRQGLSIIMITSEMPELLAMSDRVLVVHDGRTNGFFEKEDITQTNIMSAAIGV